jgi:glycine/D-amino acid oxidase-like deaminating enzyme
MTFDLHTGLSPEENSSPHNPLLHDETCQVAIIGGGITGALLADIFIQHGIETVQLEKHSFGMGSTVASTSLLLPETDALLTTLTERFGLARAKRVYELGYETLARIEELTNKLDTACDFQNRASLYLAHTEAMIAPLQKEFKMRKECGFAVDWLSQTELKTAGYSFDAPAAIRSAIGGEIDAFQLTAALIRRAIGNGLRAYTDTTVTAIEPEQHHLILRTAGSTKVHAHTVIIATGYEAASILPPKLYELSSTWVFVSEPVKSFEGWPERELIWESARPYIYLRTTPDNRIVMGGGDEPYAEQHRDQALLDQKTKALHARLSKMFPAIQTTIASSWAGTFGSSKDSLPFIGRIDPTHQLYCALGYGGNGITFSMIATQILLDLIQGKQNSDTELFRPDR